MAFEFEHTLKITEGEYLELWQTFSRKSKPVRLGLILLIGVLCLFSKWTFSFGILLLVFFLFLIFMTTFGFRFSLPRSYRDLKYLHHPLTYNVSDIGFSIIGKSIEVRSDWSNLNTWQLKGNWLMLIPNGVPPLYFKVDELINAEVYNKVLDLARKNGLEFNSREARRAKKLIERSLDK